MLFMPTYSARCAKCGTEHDYIAKVDDRNEKTPLCCDAKTERFLTTTMIPVMGLSDHYQRTSPATGRTLYGKGEIEADLKKHNLVPLSDMSGEPERQKKYAAENASKQRKEDIRKSIQKLGG